MAPVNISKRRPRKGRSTGSSEGALQIRQQIDGVFKTDGQTHHAICKTHCRKTFRPNSPVRRGRGMGDQRLGITQIIGDVDNPETVQNLERPLLTLTVRRIELERDNCSAATHLSLRKFMLRVRSQIRILDPL